MSYAWLAYVLEGKGELNESQESWERALELLKDPAEIQRASRRLATVKERMAKRAKKKEKDEDD